MPRLIYDELDARDFDLDLPDSRELNETLDARDLELMDLEARVGAFQPSKGEGFGPIKGRIKGGVTGGRLSKDIEDITRPFYVH
jgi:hypothetical protein